MLRSINKQKIKNVKHYLNAKSKFKIGDLIEMEILRGDENIVLEAVIGQIPINAPIIMVDQQEVNAATDWNSVFVTYGLLNFAKSGGEIAYVLAHELAHAVRGHVTKVQGGKILNTIIAIALGTVAETASPGTGEVVMRGVAEIGDIFTATYSRDLEREADYFGTRFVYYAGYDVDICATVHERFATEIPASMIENYLSTHPSSPERMLRIQKTIEELKKDDSTLQEVAQEDSVVNDENPAQ